MANPLNAPQSDTEPEFFADSPQICANLPLAKENLLANRILYLTGRPVLKQLLRFAGKALDSLPEGTLVDEWHAASTVVRELERQEGGLADNPAIHPLGPEYESLLIEFLKDAIQRASFNTVPTEVAMVELDQLLVYQKHIDVTFAEQLARDLGAKPDKDRIFRICLPYDHPKPPVKWSRIASQSYAFVSPSNDLRFLGTLPMENKQLQDCSMGNVVSVLGLAIGFGSNFMNAIYAENRLILNNGSHRAYALRKMGITRVPCIVQHVQSRDALDVVASHEIRSDFDLYLKHPRPPMLRDYFNTQLHKVFSFPRRLQQITVRFEVLESDIPAF